MKNSISVLSGTLESLLAGADAAAAAPMPAATTTTVPTAAIVPTVAAAAGSAPAAGDDADDASAPSAYTQMAHMLYQTKRLNDNLIQLLALYKEVGKPAYPFDPAPRQIGELVDQVASQARILLKSRGIALDLDYPAELIWSFDEDLIIGVLVHAINNAIRYTRDRVRLAIRVDGDELELRVEDNGDGFPPALLEAGAAAMARAGGAVGVNFLTNSSGLGLYFSSEVARMHKHRQRHGAVRLENGGTLGGGCFVLRLP